MTREMFYLLSVLVALLVGFALGQRSRRAARVASKHVKHPDGCGGEYGRDFCDMGGTCDRHSPWRQP